MDKTADELAYERYLRGDYSYEDYIAVCEQEDVEPLMITKNETIMERIDLYLDEPIEIVGKSGCTYGKVNHISTRLAGDEYIERDKNDILFLNEMDYNEDRAIVARIIEYYEYRRHYIDDPNFAEVSIVWKDSGERCDGFVIALNDTPKRFPEEDDKVFFYTAGIGGLCSLFDRNSDEDFYVLPDTVNFFDKL